MKIPNLKGKEAQLLLAPVPRIESLLIESEPPTDAKQSAVLALLFCDKLPETHQDLLDMKLLFIVRNSYDGVHSDQVAFPGGKCEEGDLSFIETASREAFEEMGIEKESYKVIGELTHIYVPPSNFTIYPVLAVTNSKPEFIPDSREVKEWMLVSIREFAPENVKMVKVKRTKDDLSDAPCFIVNGHILWGATAMIVSEIYQLMLEAASLKLFCNS